MIELNGIRLKNRILAAAGALGYGNGHWWHRWMQPWLVNPSIYGAVITRTLTLEPRRGRYYDPLQTNWQAKIRDLQEMPKVISGTSRVMRRLGWGRYWNRLGWWNIGIKRWITDYYLGLRKKVNLIISIGGFSILEYQELIKWADNLILAAIEVNISCPNIETDFQNDLELLEELCCGCRKSARQLPLILKIGIDCDYVKVGQIAEKAGFNAVSAINSIPANYFGPSNPKGGRSRWPFGARKFPCIGAISGRDIKLYALQVVSELREAASIPIVGGGGIFNWSDCEDFLKAGADALMMGAVHALQPWKPTWIIRRHNQI